MGHVCYLIVSTEFLVLICPDSAQLYERAFCSLHTVSHVRIFHRRNVQVQRGPNVSLSSDTTSPLIFGHHPLRSCLHAHQLWEPHNALPSVTMLDFSLGCFGILLFAACWQLWLFAQRTKDRSIEAKFSQRVSFTYFERFYRMTIPAVTWFDGDPRDASKFLQGRMRMILAANPWLAGDIVRYHGKDTLAFNRTEELDLDRAMKRAYRVLDNKGVTLNPESSRKDVRQFFFQNPDLAPRWWNKTELWSVSILPVSDNPNQFGLFVQLEHMVGDGYTFYRLYRMLVDGDTPITAMDPSRHEGIENLGLELQRKQHTRLTKYIIVAYHAFLYKFFHWNRKVESQDFLVNPEEIQKIKNAVDPRIDGVSYITTNDIIGSWLLQCTACRYLHMAVNLRHLSPKLKDTTANCVTRIVLVCNDKSRMTPVKFRKQVQGFFGGTASELPPILSRLFGGRHCFATNMSSSAGTNKLEPPNCVELKHYTLQRPNPTPPTGGFVVINRYNEGRLLIRITHGFGMKAVECPPFAKPIDV